MAITKIDGNGGYGETSFSLDLGSGSGQYQVVCTLLQSNSAIPSTPTVTIGGTTLSSFSYTFDAGERTGESTGYRYGRGTIHHGNVGFTGVKTVSCSYSATWQSIYALSYTGVNHVHTSSVGTGSGTTLCSRSFTANATGSKTILQGSMWIQDEEPIQPESYSNTSVSQNSMDCGVGQENNTTTSVASGFSWTSRGACDGYRIIGVLLDVASTPVETIVTGETISVTGGSVDSIVGISETVEVASISITGGTVVSEYSGGRFYCDPYTDVVSGDGSSWESPFANLDDLFSSFSADNGDIGYVKAGRFTTTSAILKPPSGVTLYGGFSRSLRGTSAPVEDRQWLTDKTIIDMSGAYGVDTPWGCISYVTPGISQSDGFVLDGFHFHNCTNDLSSTAGYGGAINCDSQDGWKILNCWFENCDTKTGGYGGAIFVAGEGNLGVKHQIVNCRFVGCNAPGTALGVGGGGGVALVGTTAIVSKCTFVGCSGGTGGGLLVIDTSDPNEVEDSEFRLCEAVYKGSSIAVIDNADAVSFDRIRIKTSAGSGTAFFTAQSSSSFPVSVKNSQVVDNDYNGIETSGDGYDNLAVINCTIANNGGNGLISAGSPMADIVSIYNSIIYGNTVGQISGSVTVCQYSDIQGGFSGTGNIDQDPQFAGSNHFEPYAIAYESECVDAGSSGVTGYDATDITGFVRTGTPDMGCIESYPTIWGTIDATLYNFDMSSENLSSGGFLPAANFQFPYLLQQSPSQLLDPAKKGGPSNPCYPIWVGSEIEIESFSALLVEVFTQTFGNQVLQRGTIGPGAESGKPSWNNEFIDDQKSSGHSTHGNSFIATTGRSSSGIGFSVYGEKSKLFYESIRYSVTHLGNASSSDDVRVYNVWLEGHPQVDRTRTDYCAKWIYIANSVAQADYPVSSALMQELVKKLNYIVWENRGPMSVPVFGIYWKSKPELPVI